APVVAMRNYQQDVQAYTSGRGRLFCSMTGYEICHNPAEVLETVGYNAARDVENPTSSIFCKNGTSFTVNWDEVKKYMHVESIFETENLPLKAETTKSATYPDQAWLEPEEIEKIFQQTYYANQKEKTHWQK